METEIIMVPESFRDLLNVETAILATMGRDGFPQVTATWFLYDETDKTVKLWLIDRRQKTKNMRANPNVTLFILDPLNQFRTLEIRAKVELTTDPELVFEKRIGQKYGVADFRCFEQEGDTRSLVTLYSTKINVLDQAPPDWSSVTPR